MNIYNGMLLSNYEGTWSSKSISAYNFPNPCYNLQRDNYYLWLPNHTYNLTSFMCGSIHRKGLLCAECEVGFGPALYSYTLECSKCWGHGYGWLLYITLTVIPTTALYIIVVLFHVSATSPPLSAFILFCHLTVYTIRSQSFCTYSFWS